MAATWADRYSPSSVSFQSAHTSCPLVMASFLSPEAAIHLPVGKFLHLQGGNLPTKASIEQSQLCPWAPHRTRPLNLPQYRFRYLQAEASTIPTISGFHGDRGHICPVFFFCLPSAPCTLLAPEEKLFTCFLVECSKLLFSRSSISSSFNYTSKNLFSSLLSLLFPHHASTLVFQKLKLCFY